MRPFQLPTCPRRLFVAAVAGQLGPVVEPRFCGDQAAVAGGRCGGNLGRAFVHRERAATTRAARTPLAHRTRGRPGSGGGFGGGRSRGPRGGDTPPPDEGNPEPEAKPPATPDDAAAASTSEPVPPPDEGEPEPGADTPAAAK